jgi:hypothetical protein
MIQHLCFTFWTCRQLRYILRRILSFEYTNQTKNVFRYHRKQFIPDLREWQRNYKDVNEEDRHGQTGRQTDRQTERQTQTSMRLCISVLQTTRKEIKNSETKKIVKQKNSETKK